MTCINITQRSSGPAPSGGGWPSKTGGPSGGGRSNAPAPAPKRGR